MGINLLRKDASGQPSQSPKASVPLLVTRHNDLVEGLPAPELSHSCPQSLNLPLGLTNLGLSGGEVLRLDSGSHHVMSSQGIGFNVVFVVREDDTVNEQQHELSALLEGGIC